MGWRWSIRNPFVATASAGAFWYALYCYKTDPIRLARKNPRLLDAAPDGKAAHQGPPPKIFGWKPWFQSYTLRSVEDVNHDTKRLRFDLPLSYAVSGLNPVSAVLTKANIKNSWLPTLRPYTPVSDPLNDRGHLDLLVKKYPDGAMSTHLHTLQPGDTHSFLNIPIPGAARYPLGMGEKNIILIAGGAGITPLYQFTKVAFADAAHKRPEAVKFDAPKITLVFGVNTPSDLLFHDEFRELERQYPNNFRCVYTVSHPEKERGFKGAVAPLFSDYETGYVDKALLEKWCPKPDAFGGVKILLCGPPGMEEAMAGKKGKELGGVLGALGYRKSQLAQM